MLTPMLENFLRAIRVCTPLAPSTGRALLPLGRDLLVGHRYSAVRERNGVMLRPLSPTIFAVLLTLALLLVIPWLDRYATYLLIRLLSPP